MQTFKVTFSGKVTSDLIVTFTTEYMADSVDESSNAGKEAMIHFAAFMEGMDEVAPDA